MATPLGQLATSSKCAIYNELSHLNPRYLTPQRYPNLFQEQETSYHRRNLVLLSLYFDKVIVSIENLLGFTRFTSRDVVSRVVLSDWFQDLVDHGIIVLAGWGHNDNVDMLLNQEEYSAQYRADLKDPSYRERLRSITERATWTIRDPSSRGESDHIDFLDPLLRAAEGIFEPGDHRFLIDLIHHTSETLGHLGSLDLFPYFDEIWSTRPEYSDAFYRAYYRSWHYYSAAHYAPAIPIQTRVVEMGSARVKVGINEPAHLCALYSPNVFLRYLSARYDRNTVARLLAADINDLIRIRNGDWARFKRRYHEYVAAASKICWIALHPDADQILEDDNLIDEVLRDVVAASPSDNGLAALGNALDLALGLSFGATGVAPALTLFKGKIARHVRRFSGRILPSETEPYLRKLQALLDSQDDRRLILSAQ